MTVSYSQPQNTTLNADNTFTVPVGGSAIVPVTYSFIVNNPLANSEAVQLQGINYNGGPTVTFMASQSQWRTASI